MYKEDSRVKALRGFTLVELLVVMAIMSVLIGISVAGLGYAMRRSRNIARQAAVANLDRALESYYSDNQVYPLISDQASTELLITTTLVEYLEGSWDAPPHTCIVYISYDGIRYVTGANQEEANAKHSCFWAGPALGYSADWPDDSSTDSCISFSNLSGYTQMDYIEAGSNPDWAAAADCPDTEFDWLP